MQENKLVSIIMPLYNGKLHLHEAINSVINQTYVFWELLIIDDCSTDDSKQIAIKFADKYNHQIKVFETNNNGGPASARNIGTTNANGKFICFLDSDDIWLQDKLEKQVSFIQKFDYSIIFSNYEKISYSGERRKRIVSLPEKVSYSSLLKINSIPCLTALYNTEKTGKLFQNTKRHFVSYEDYLMWLDILKKGFIAYNTTDVVALYRLSQNSISKNKFKMIKKRWRLYREVEKLNIYASIYNICHYFIMGFSKYII